jgi:CMP-N-acetylneuraminic acid synthetase
MDTPRCVAFIPARAGSIRIKEKNIQKLKGHPLIAYTIVAALQANIFSDIIVSTDSPKYARISEYYGGSVPFLRPKEYATEYSPDIEWLSYTLNRLMENGKYFDAFCILRPTSPFRLSSTIRRAWELFLLNDNIDSLRAVEKCHEHPGKMWIIRNNLLLPLLPFSLENQPWHNSPYQSLPEVYIQNASLEIAWTRVVLENRSISGTAIIPFIASGYEGFDINNEEDWMIAETLLQKNKAVLPEIINLPYEVVIE